MDNSISLRRVVMTNLFLLLVAVLVMLSTSGCQTKESQINDLEQAVIEAEQSFSVLTVKDWEHLETDLSSLQEQLETNRDLYSEVEIQKINQLQGRYAALVFKRESKNIENSIKDAGDQIKGFMKGLEDAK